MWSYRQRTDFDKGEPRIEKEMFGRGLGWERGRKGEFQIGDARVTHIDWLKNHHLALETFQYSAVNEGMGIVFLEFTQACVLLCIKFEPHRSY